MKWAVSKILRGCLLALHDYTYAASIIPHGKARAKHQNAAAERQCLVVRQRLVL